MAAEWTTGRGTIPVPSLQAIGVMLLVLLLAVSLFCHLSYPLLWNDESETALFGDRILTCGYPKIHHQQRVVYCANWPDAALAIDEAHDAYVGTTWGHFYLATIGILLSRTTPEMYQKTFLIRLPFAILGLASMVLLLHLLGKILPKKDPHRLIPLLVFAAIELLSISLVLHLREARYYSLLLFLLISLLYAYCAYRFLRTMPYRPYCLVMTGLLVLIFNTFYPAFFILGLVVLAYELLRFGWLAVFRRAATAQRGALSSQREMVKAIIPVIASGILIAPLFSYYHVFQLAGQLSAGLPSYQGSYWHRLANILSFFRTYEFLDLLIFLQVIAGLSMLLREKNGNGEGDADTIPLRIAAFFCFLIGIYCVVAARSTVLFQRYYIVLQPLIAAAIALNAWGISRFSPVGRRRGVRGHLLKAAAYAVMIVLGVSGIVAKYPTLKGHLEEMVVRYRGQLDYVIPYLAQRYPNTGAITVATNYEETSYLFYLNARIINMNTMGIGDEMGRLPDVIIYRRSWGHRASQLHTFLAHASYEMVSFPIADDKVNNCPEIEGVVAHRYQSHIPSRPEERAVIYCLKDASGETDHPPNIGGGPHQRP